MTAATSVLDALLSRVDGIEAEVGERFPLYARAGRWFTTRRGSWAGGYWVGLLWLRAMIRGRAAEVAVAQRWACRLLPRVSEDTDTCGMTFWYGAGVAHSLTGDRIAAEVASTGAEALAARIGSHATVDSLAGVTALLVWAGQADLAHAHANRIAAFPPHEPFWERGHAWAMLGFAVAARRVGPSYLDRATSLARWWLENRPEPSDSSAGAIAAAALYLLPDHRPAAESLLDRVTSRVGKGGVLGSGQYEDFDDLETVWGTYYATAMLAASTGRVPGVPW